MLDLTIARAFTFPSNELSLSLGSTGMISDTTRRNGTFGVLELDFLFSSFGFEKLSVPLKEDLSC